MVFCFLLFPVLIFSGEFIARVDQNQIKLGERFILTLTLQDATTRESPYIDSLKKLFLVYSQQQSSNTVILNGQTSSRRSWHVTLIPQEEGEFTIPSMSIDTSEGILVSEPITIYVGKGSSLNSEGSKTEGVELISEVNKDNPYKNEPVIYTVKLISKRNLANLQLQKIEIEGAIIEAHEEPKIYEKTLNGMQVNIIEFTHLITPLKAGLLKIPEAVIQGAIPIKGQGRSLLDMLQGFDQLEPFTLKTKETYLEVQGSVAGMSSWLPAKSLKIEEILDASQAIQEGQPFIRSFKIIAEGVRSNQLPSLNELQISDGHFKIYADKPELGDEIKEGQIKSYRKEQYTLIPQKSGLLVLPELCVVWWDVEKKEKMTSIIPSRTLQVSPLPGSVVTHEITPIEQESQVVVVQRNLALYIVIAGLATLLIIAGFLGVRLQKKLTSFTKTTVNVKEKPKQPVKPKLVQKTSKKEKKEKLPDLNPT